MSNKHRTTSSSRPLPGHSKHQPIGFKKSACLNGHVRRDPGSPQRGPLPEAQPRRMVVSLQERGGGDRLGSSQKLTKLLIHVTVQRSISPVNVIISPESTVGDLIKATLEVYAREGRRPLLSTTDPSAFELHFSQFILESLNAEERIMSLGSRNFFLCPKQGAPNNKNTSCANEAEKVRHSNRASPSRLLEIMDFLL